MPTDLLDTIQSSLQTLASTPLRSAATALLRVLGYQSDRTLDLPG